MTEEKDLATTFRSIGAKDKKEISIASKLYAAQLSLAFGKTISPGSVQDFMNANQIEADDVITAAKIACKGAAVACPIIEQL